MPAAWAWRTPIHTFALLTMANGLIDGPFHAATANRFAGFLTATVVDGFVPMFLKAGGQLRSPFGVAWVHFGQLGERAIDIDPPQKVLHCLLHGLALLVVFGRSG